MYETILFPTDGSEGASAALAHAADHARQYDAAIHVLFVADTAFERIGMVGADHDEESTEMTGTDHDRETSPMVGEDAAGMAPETDGIAALEAGGKAIVENVAAELDDVPVTTAVERGDPYRRILDYADSVDADLIVMGTHGRTGLDRYLLGSVTEKVVRTADAPVLTVRFTEQ